MAKTEATVANVVQPTIASLKEEGSRAFAMKKYAEATAAWDRALKMDSITPSDVALIHNNKAACHMVNKKYKEAIAECSAALEAQPEYLKALIRRSKAYEALGQYKQALADLQSANKLDGATDETRAAERRVKDLASGKAPNGTHAARKTPTSIGSAVGSGRQMAIPVKLSYGGDTRAFQANPGVTYSELMEHSKALFPAAYPFVLKFLDKQGDLVTIGSRADINFAIQEAVDSVDKKKLAQGAGLPPIRLQAVKVASADQVPKAPEEEQRNMQAVLEQLQKFQQLQSKGKNSAGTRQQQQQQAEQQQLQQHVVVDEWILALVDLLKEHVGVDPDRPAELQEIGHEKLTAGFQAMMTNDPKADELLDQAEEKFREMAASGMASQGQVWEGKTQMLMQKAATEGKNLSEISTSALALLDKAEAKVKEALAYCPTLLDGFLILCNIEQDRAKLAANYAVPPVAPREDIADPATRQSAEEEASKAAMLKAFERVTKEGVSKADEYMEKAYQHLKDGLEALPDKEKNVELKPLKPIAEQIPGDPEDATPLKATLLINLGNAHYEHSILRAAGGLDWRSLVERSQALFREAGAAEIDIRNALKGHPKADEMQDIIGPEPESEVAEGVSAAPAADEQTKVKGLPSLGPRKKKETTT